MENLIVIIIALVVLVAPPYFHFEKYTKICQENLGKCTKICQENLEKCTEVHQKTLEMYLNFLQPIIITLIILFSITSLVKNSNQISKLDINCTKENKK